MKIRTFLVACALVHGFAIVAGQQPLYYPPAGGGAGAGGGLSTTYDATAYGIACDGTDQSADLTALMAGISTAGGGTIYFPACTSTYRFNSQILIPNDAAGPQPNQKNFRFTGPGGGPHWYGVGAAVLDLRYTAADGNAKIETRGLGTIQIDNLTIKDGGASNATPFVHSTNTTVQIHNNSFIGSGNVGQDAIVLGGSSTTLSGNVNSPFQGYGSHIYANHFRALNRGLYGLTYANAINFTENSFQANVGTVAIEIDGSGGGANTSYGNVISNNTIEMDIYTYGIKLTGAQYNTFVGNQFHDPDGSVTSYYNLNATATQNIFICGVNPVARPTWSGTTVSIEANTYICPRATGADSGARGTQTTEFAYGVIGKGTYDSTKVYPGQVIASDQHNPNESLSFGLDHANLRGVIEAKNNATGLPIIVGFDGNTIYAAGANILCTQWGTSINDLTCLSNGGGTSHWDSNAEGIKVQVLAAAGLTAAVRLASDRCIGFNSATNLGAGALDAEFCRPAADLMAPSSGDSLGFASKAWTNTAPSGPVACTTPTVTWSNGTATFQVDVGTTCAGISTLVVTLPAVTNAYMCDAMNVTTSATARVEMTASTTTTATFTNYTRTTGAALVWVDGADVRIKCSGG